MYNIKCKLCAFINTTVTYMEESWNIVHATYQFFKPWSVEFQVWEYLYDLYLHD